MTTKTPYIANVYADGFNTANVYLGGTALDSAIRKVASVARAVEKELHKVAVSCLYHAEQTGDFTKLSKLINSLRNGRTVKNGSLRLQGLMLWVETYSPARWDNKGEQYKKNKADDAVPFDVKAAAEVPYWDLSQENVPDAVTLGDVYALLIAAAKKAESMTKATEKRESLIEGDPIAVKRVTSLAATLNKLAEPFKEEAETEAEIAEEIAADKAVERIFANNAAKIKAKEPTGNVPAVIAEANPTPEPTKEPETVA